LWHLDSSNDDQQGVHVDKRLILVLLLQLPLLLLLLATGAH